jgi:putative heme-binding domain-containing protein
LDHPNAWHRDTAARLLYEKRVSYAGSEIASGLIGRLQLDSAHAQARVHALWVLAGWDFLEEMHISAGLADSDSGVVENALRCLEFLKIGRGESPGRMEKELTKVADSNNARILHQLAWTLSIKPMSNASSLLVKILSTDARDPYIRAAALVAARKQNLPLFETLIGNGEFAAKPGAVEFLSQIATTAPANTLEEALNKAAAMQNQAAAFQLAAAVTEAMDQRKLARTATLQDLFAKAGGIGSSASSETQLAAVRLLRLSDAQNTDEIMSRLFLTAKSGSVRLEAFRALTKSLQPAAALLLNNWAMLPTSVRQGAVDILLARNEGPALLISALKKSQITRADLTASQTQTLRQHSNPAISRPALELLGAINTDRAAVIERFRSALQKHGDPQLGEKIFTERCATCHRYAGKGAAVGPDLESVRGNDREYLLTQMLDPNREVNSRYVLYQADLREGDTVSGILARETDAEVTLRLANAEEKTIPRTQIKRLAASAQSLMPVGLEEGLGENEIASLLDYLGKNP